MQDIVEIRAFRGSRRASVYRKHFIARRDLGRVHELATRERLPVLASLNAAEARDLEKDDARRLAAEVASLQAAAELPELDHDLTLIAELARWCARTRGRAWLRIGG